ncbi:MAG: hypothetical protein ACXV2E_08030 [Halobacteriota archaeon]
MASSRREEKRDDPVVPDENSIESWVVTGAIAWRWKEKARGTLRQLGKLKDFSTTARKSASALV